jgi:hypothetical protein
MEELIPSKMQVLSLVTAQAKTKHEFKAALLQHALNRAMSLSAPLKKFASTYSSHVPVVLASGLSWA